MKARRTIFELYFDYIEHYGGSITPRSLLRLTSELGISTNAARAALCRLTKQGWLARTQRHSLSLYSLTSLGRERLEEIPSRLFCPHNQVWDGQWTFLTYSVPGRLSHHRDRLRRELMWLGFGSYAPGMWISPNPNVEVTLRHLSLRNLDRYVHIFRSRQVSSQPHSMLIERCYDLEKIQSRYTVFLRKWRPSWSEYQSRFSTGDPPRDNMCFVTKMHLLYEFGRFLNYDPFLPSELLPQKWSGHEAWRLFRDFYLVLAEPALNFFDRCFEGPPEMAKKDYRDELRALDRMRNLA